MERPPSETKGVVKKGSWSPEEDLLLLSYIQEKGPGDWKSVPKNAGLQRCKRSCRLRWKNYLQPDIKRGGFTADEDRKIINLQALLGNKWSAIARYFPHRTDNDIKNYWNACLKKKVNEAAGGDDGHGSSSNATQSRRDTRSSNDIWVTRLQNNIDTAREALFNAITIAPEASSHNLGATTPLTLPVMSSTIVATSGLRSFDSVHGRNSEQDPLINGNDNDYHLSSTEPTPVGQASNSYPSSVKNIAYLLDGWTKEFVNHESARGEIIDLMNINSVIIRDQGMMNDDNPMIPLLTSTENSMMPYEANYVSHPHVVATSALADPIPNFYPFPPVVTDPYPFPHAVTDPFADLYPFPPAVTDPFADPYPFPPVVADPFADPLVVADPFTPVDPFPPAVAEPFADPFPPTVTDPFADPFPPAIVDPFSADPSAYINDEQHGETNDLSMFNMSTWYNDETWSFK